MREIFIPISSGIFTKSKQIFRRETPKAPRFAEKIFSVTLGDFGEIRRMNFFPVYLRLIGVT